MNMGEKATSVYVAFWFPKRNTLEARCVRVKKAKAFNVVWPLCLLYTLSFSYTMVDNFESNNKLSREESELVIELILLIVNLCLFFPVSLDASKYNYLKIIFKLVPIVPCKNVPLSSMFSLEKQNFCI